MDVGAVIDVFVGAVGVDIGVGSEYDEPLDGEWYADAAGHARYTIRLSASLVRSIDELASLLGSPLPLAVLVLVISGQDVEIVVFLHL